MMYQEVEKAVAIAIHEKLDIIEAMPSLYDIPTEKLEDVVEKYITELQDQMSWVIDGMGQDLLKKKDAEGLQSLLIKNGLKVPADMLLSMCQLIVQESNVQTRCLGYLSPNKENPQVIGGEIVYPARSVWYVKMEL